MFYHETWHWHWTVRVVIFFTTTYCALKKTETHSINFIKSQSLRTHLLTLIGSTRKALLLHAEVGWLSWEAVLHSFECELNSSPLERTIERQTPRILFWLPGTGFLENEGSGSDASRIATDCIVANDKIRAFKQKLGIWKTYTITASVTASQYLKTFPMRSVVLLMMCMGRNEEELVKYINIWKIFIALWASAFQITVVTKSRIGERPTQKSKWTSGF